MVVVGRHLYLSSQLKFTSTEKKKNLKKPGRRVLLIGERRRRLTSSPPMKHRCCSQNAGECLQAADEKPGVIEARRGVWNHLRLKPPLPLPPAPASSSTS